MQQVVQSFDTWLRLCHIPSAAWCSSPALLVALCELMCCCTLQAQSSGQLPEAQPDLAAGGQAAQGATVPLVAADAAVTGAEEVPEPVYCYCQQVCASSTASLACKCVCKLLTP